MNPIKIPALLAAFALAFGLSSAQAKTTRIGLVLPDLSNAAIADINDGAKERAAALGNIEILTTATYSGEEQAKAVENYVAQGVDLIAYDSIDAAAVGPAVVKANRANIPVIAIVSEASSGKVATFMTPDFREDGRIIGRWMSKKLGPNGIVAHIQGNPADSAGAALTSGFQEGLAEGGIHKIVAMAPSDWDRERGLTIANDMITAHPDLQGLYAANDDVAMGALQALNSAGLVGKLMLAGHNGTCEALASILQNKLDFTVMLFNKPTGALMVDTALQVLQGKKVEPHMAAPVLGIDAELSKAVLGGSANIPANIGPEVKSRVDAAQRGCSK